MHEASDTAPAPGVPRRAAARRPGRATLLIKLSSATAELLADVALARSVTHRGDTTIAGVIEDLVHRSRGQLEEEAEVVKQKRRREHK